MHTEHQPLTARRSGPLQGRVRVPGDKSISHRALILGALAVGETRISGLLEGEDVLNTAKAVRALGRARRAHAARANGACTASALRASPSPPAPLDFGNSGTGCRLMLGAVAGCPIAATFDGDASLRKRPMRRVLEPLERIGARTLASSDGRLPLTLAGARDPIPIVYRAAGRVGAAQVGGAARRPCGAGRDGRHRSRGDARPHREDAGAFRRGCPGRAAWRTWPPHHACRAARTGAAADRGPGRSVIGGVSAGRGGDHAGLRCDPRRRDAQSVARRADRRHSPRWAPRSSGSNARNEGGEEVADLRVRGGALRGVEVPAARAPVDDRRISGAGRRGRLRGRHDGDARAQRSCG